MKNDIHVVDKNNNNYFHFQDCGKYKTIKVFCDNEETHKKMINSAKISRERHGII